MRIQLSDHFTYQRLLRFTLPSIVMMICTSVYSIVDGLFVSNFVGKTPFAALNLIMPVLMAFGTVGFMIGTGGSAVVGIVLGEGKREKANEYFSMLIYVAVVIGIVLALVGSFFLRPIAAALGAEGENGVAAYGVIMYANFIFVAVYIGYSIGSAPVVSFHYGAKNETELKSLFRKSLILLGSVGLVMTFLSEILAGPLTKIFVGYDEELFLMTCRGFRLYALSFLISGINIWGSGFFTALGDGGVSAAISFLRTLVFQLATVAVLPVFLGLTGIWLSVFVAELLALAVTAGFLIQKRKKYHY